MLLVLPIPHLLVAAVDLPCALGRSTTTTAAASNDAARIAALVNWPVVNGEGLQVLHYRPGAEYKPHHDYFDPAQPGMAAVLRRGGAEPVGTAAAAACLFRPDQRGKV